MTFFQFRVVLMSYYRRPVVWLCLAAYAVWWGCFVMQTIDARRELYTSVPITSPLLGVHQGADSRYRFQSDGSWERIRLMRTSDGAWSYEDLLNDRILASTTKLDASWLVGTPEERATICGQTEWPTEGTPAEEKLLAFYDDFFTHLAKFPNLTHLAIPPMRLTGKFAELCRKHPRVKCLVFSGCTVLPDGWQSIAQLQGIKQLEFRQSILHPGIGRLSELKDLEILSLDACWERETPFLTELDQLHDVQEFRIGWVQPEKRESASDGRAISIQSPYEGELMTRLIQLKTKARIRLLMDSETNITLRRYEALQNAVKNDPRFLPGFISPFASAGLGHTFIPAGILIFLLAIHLFGQLAAPQAWLASGMARSQAIVAVGIWSLHVLAMLVYGSFWGTSPWAMLAVQLLLPGAWGFCCLLSYQIELIGQKASTILWTLMCALSGSVIQIPFFLGMIPGGMEFAAGEMQLATQLAVLVGAALCGIVISQLPGLPRAIEIVGAGNFPLQLSFSEIQRFQQQRMNQVKEGQLLAKFSSIKLALLLPGTFWNSAIARARHWSAPVPFTWPICLLGCIAAPLVGCLAVLVVQWLINGYIDTSRRFIVPVFFVILLQTPIMLIFVLASQWLERSRMEVWEVLRPMTRQDLGTTYAKSLAIQTVPLAGWSLLTTFTALMLDREPNSFAANWPAWTIPAILVTVGLGWGVIWACLLAMLASGGWWRRVLMATLGGVGLLGMATILALSLPNRDQPPHLRFPFDGLAGCGGVLLLSIGLVVFFRLDASHQWLTREFTER
jgi:hypothetical protein